MRILPWCAAPLPPARLMEMDARPGSMRKPWAGTAGNGGDDFVLVRTREGECWNNSQDAGQHARAVLQGKAKERGSKDKADAPPWGLNSKRHTPFALWHTPSASRHRRDPQVHPFAQFTQRPRIHCPCLLPLTRLFAVSMQSPLAPSMSDLAATLPVPHLGCGALTSCLWTTWPGWPWATWNRTRWRWWSGRRTAAWSARSQSPQSPSCPAGKPGEGRGGEGRQHSQGVRITCEKCWRVLCDCGPLET